MTGVIFGLYNLRMRLSRPFLLFAVVLAIVSLLFTQLAVAGYACPTLKPLQEMTNLADIGMAQDCDETDVEQRALCEAHMQAPDQSADRQASPTIPPAIAVPLVMVPGVLNVAELPAVACAPQAWLTHPSEPSLSIRNCCFRI